MVIYFQAQQYAKANIIIPNLIIHNYLEVSPS